jgi:prepilin-type N-terminal cleavage/methylation domain-containing protein
MRRRTALEQRQHGFTLVELMVVVLISGVILAAVLGLYGSVFRTTADQGVRIQNQDSARIAMYEMSRFIRAACSSDSNLTSVSDSLALANPQEFVFFVDLDGDDAAEKVRYYLSGTTLRMQMAEPNTSVIPHTYPTSYTSDSVVILGGVRNGTNAIFTYYGYNGTTGALYQIATPNTAPLRRAVVAIGVNLTVNEKPEIARGAVQVSTRVQIRQRYDGGLDGG